MELSRRTVIFPAMKIGAFGIILGAITIVVSHQDLNLEILSLVGTILLGIISGMILAIVGQFIRVVIDSLLPEFVISTFWGVIWYKILFRYGFPFFGAIMGVSLPLALFSDVL